MRRLSAESLCGLSSLCILSSTIFFRPAPVNAIFSIFLFTLPPGAFYLTLPVVIHPFAFDRILFLEDLLAPLFQRHCITAHTAAGICKTRGLTSNWGQSSFDALFKPLKELTSQMWLPFQKLHPLGYAGEYMTAGACTHKCRAFGLVFGERPVTAPDG